MMISEFEDAYHNRHKQELGIPSMTSEANMVGPRGYDDTQVKARIQAFMEMLEAKKYPKK